jgi:AcrR family transcriptional regulator
VLAKGRDRIEAILDAATRILIDEGYARLSTRKIAAGAGVRPGHLQYYYPTKQDVVRGLLERYLARATAALGERLGADTSNPAPSRGAARRHPSAVKRTSRLAVFLGVWPSRPATPPSAAIISTGYWRAIVGAFDAEPRSGDRAEAAPPWSPARKRCSPVARPEPALRRRASGLGGGSRPTPADRQPRAPRGTPAPADRVAVAFDGTGARGNPSSRRRRFASSALTVDSSPAMTTSAGPGAFPIEHGAVMPGCRSRTAAPQLPPPPDPW